MTIAIQKTLTITIDDQVYTVADLSEETKQLVVYLDDWRQDETDQTSALLKTRAGLRDIQNMILAQIQKDIAASTEVDENVPEDVEVVTEEVTTPKKPSRSKK